MGNLLAAKNSDKEQEKVPKTFTLAVQHMRDTKALHVTVYKSQKAGFRTFIDYFKRSGYLVDDNIESYDNQNVIVRSGTEVQTQLPVALCFERLGLGGRGLNHSFFASPAVIFVVDSEKSQLYYKDLPHQLRYLGWAFFDATMSSKRHQLESVDEIPLLIFVNKQDMSDELKFSMAEVTDQVHKAMANIASRPVRSPIHSPTETKGRTWGKWHIQPCSFRDGTGVKEGLEWLLANIPAKMLDLVQEIREQPSVADSSTPTAAV